MKFSLADKLLRVEFCPNCPFDEALRYLPVRRVYVWKYTL